MQSKSALRGSRIFFFVELWCLGASGGLDFLVLSTSFLKNNIGWRQQNPTEKLSKIHLIVHKSTKTLGLSNHHNNIKIR